MGALPLAVEDHAVSKFLVSHLLPETTPSSFLAPEAPLPDCLRVALNCASGPRDLHARPNFLDVFVRNLGDEARLLREVFYAKACVAAPHR